MAASATTCYKSSCDYKYYKINRGHTNGSTTCDGTCYGLVNYTLNGGGSNIVCAAAIWVNGSTYTIYSRVKKGSASCGSGRDERVESVCSSGTIYTGAKTGKTFVTTCESEAYESEGISAIAAKFGTYKCNTSSGYYDTQTECDSHKSEGEICKYTDGCYKAESQYFTFVLIAGNGCSQGNQAKLTGGVYGGDGKWISAGGSYLSSGEERTVTTKGIVGSGQFDVCIEDRTQIGPTVYSHYIDNASLYIDNTGRYMGCYGNGYNCNKFDGSSGGGGVGASCAHIKYTLEAGKTYIIRATCKTNKVN